MSGTSAGRRPLVEAGLHLFALWSVAVAAPLFDLMRQNPDFLAFRRMDGLDIVLFAVALAFAPPLLLLALEALAGLVGVRARELLHLVFVAALVVLIGAQIFKKLGVDATVLLVALAVAAGIAATALYARRDQVRSFVTVLSAIGLVFPAYFLLTAPVSDLVFAKDVGVSAARVAGNVPVVMVVFDEISTVALLDEHMQIDPDLFPHFAALARDATFFRYARAPTDETRTAIPVLLTGSVPRTLDESPILANYPHNLFTFLGRSYRMEVSQEAGDLCPRSVCNELTRGNLASRVRSLASDTSLVYLHVIAPPKEEDNLPSVSDTLGDFRADTEKAKVPAVDVIHALQELSGRRAERFLQVVAAIRPTSAPTLYYKHSLLPHTPFQYLPSGRSYTGAQNVPGIEAEPAWGNAYLREQMYQRHLLQSQFADRLLGTLLQRLRKTNMYKRALIVVTADGGESFLHPANRNDVTMQNIEDIAATPLLVKAPGEQRGRVVDRPVRMTDVLPTIADLLHARLPWKVEGRSAWRSSAGIPRSVTVLEKDGNPLTISAADFRRRLRESVERKLALFGSGEGGLPRLFSFGPRPELLGKRASQFQVTQDDVVKARINDVDAYDHVDLRSGSVPAQITGRIDGPAATARDLAVVLNGTIVGVAPSFELAGSKEEQFSIVVPDEYFRDGRNSVQVLWVKGSAASPTLDLIASNGSSP